MTNESDGNYSANVTISSYVVDHEIEQPWNLAWIWVKKETLFGTLGSEGTQHGFVSFSEDADIGTYTYCLNNVTLDLPRQTDLNCIGGTVILPRFVRDEIAKGSTSFQISVSHYNRGHRAQPPYDVTLSTRGFEYELEYDSMEQVIDTHLSKSTELLAHHIHTFSFVSFYESVHVPFFCRYLEYDVHSLHLQDQKVPRDS